MSEETLAAAMSKKRNNHQKSGSISNLPSNRSSEESRNIKGSVHINGPLDVVVDLPKEIKTENAERIKILDERDRIKRRLDIATFVGIALYTVLTAWVAITSQTLANLTRKQFVASERPYILVAKMRVIPFDINTRVGANVMFVNYGKSPALRMWSIGQLFVGEHAYSEAEAFIGAHANDPYNGGSQTNVPPHVPAPDVWDQYATLRSDRPVTAADVAWMSDHDGGIVIISRTYYEDMYGDHYYTDSCRLYLKSQADAMCPGHNDIN